MSVTTYCVVDNTLRSLHLPNLIITGFFVPIRTIVVRKRLPHLRNQLQHIIIVLWKNHQREVYDKRGTLFTSYLRNPVLLHDLLLLSFCKAHEGRTRWFRGALVTWNLLCCYLNLRCGSIAGMWVVFWLVLGRTKYLCVEMLEIGILLLDFHQS